MVSSVYVIINEASVAGVDDIVTEIVGPARWNYQDALDDLADIARDAGVNVHSATSVYLPVEGTHLEADEYYIIELEVSDRG